MIYYPKLKYNYLLLLRDLTPLNKFPTVCRGYATFRSGRYGLVDLVWPFWSGRFGLGRFGLGRFGLGTFRSGYEIFQKSYMFTFNVNILKSTRKTTNMIQDPTVNKHQHMIFIIISKKSK